MAFDRLRTLVRNFAADEPRCLSIKMFMPSGFMDLDDLVILMTP